MRHDVWRDRTRYPFHSTVLGYSETKMDGDLAVSRGRKQKGKQWHHYSHAARPYVQLLAAALRSEERKGETSPVKQTVPLSLLTAFAGLPSQKQKGRTCESILSPPFVSKEFVLNHHKKGGRVYRKSPLFNPFCLWLGGAGPKQKGLSDSSERAHSSTPFVCDWVALVQNKRG